METPSGRKLVFSEQEFIQHPRRKGLSLPCGRCIGCKLEKARQWAVRLSHEAQLHEEVSFITLTYEKPPKGVSVDVPTCQKFLKRLRARLHPKKIRHFLVGEYGELMDRPHYHAIIFGHSFPEKTRARSSRSRKGKVHTLFRSDFLDEVWGLGHCWIGNVSFDSCAYVAGYCVKKVTGPKAARHYEGRAPEFAIMSRGGKHKRGIGHEWIKKFASDVYPDDEIISNGKPCRPPRYYDRVLEADNPGLLEVIKKKRETEAETLEEQIDRETGEIIEVLMGPNYKRLNVMQQVAEAKQKMRRRKYEMS